MLTVASALPKEVMAIASLLEELEAFYGGHIEEQPIDERCTQIDHILFGERPVAHVLLAKVDGLPVGLASYSYLWPAVGLTRSLYLKELFVSEPHRRRGVGAALMRELVAVATTSGCSRVEWTTDRDNSLAIKFYDGQAFLRNDGKVLYRLALG